MRQIKKILRFRRQGKIASQRKGQVDSPDGQRSPLGAADWRHTTQSPPLGENLPQRAHRTASSYGCLQDLPLPCGPEPGSEQGGVRAHTRATVGKCTAAPPGLPHLPTLSRSLPLRHRWPVGDHFLFHSCYPPESLLLSLRLRVGFQRTWTGTAALGDFTER